MKNGVYYLDKFHFHLVLNKLVFDKMGKSIIDETDKEYYDNI